MSQPQFSVDPRSEDFFHDPYPAYERFHAAGSRIFWKEYGFWCFAGFDDVNEILRDRRFSRVMPCNDEIVNSSPGQAASSFDAVEAHSLLELEPPDHTRLRRMVNRAFVSRLIEALRPAIIEITANAIEAIAPKRQAELIADFATPVPVRTIMALLKVDRSCEDAILNWSHAMVRMYMFDRDDETRQKADQAADEFSAFLRDMLQKRRHSPGRDLVSAMIEACQEPGALTEDEIVSTLILLLNAGHEATVHQIGNAVFTILNSGMPPAALFESDDATRATVEECLRFDPPLHMFTRYALRAVDLGQGPVLAKGDTIGLLLGAANRDPSRFERPGDFLPARQDPGHVAFGAGIHFCLGAALARLEMEIALPMIFDRLPGLALDGTAHYRDAYHFHGLERLPVRW